MSKINLKYVDVETSDLRGFIITPLKEYVINYDDDYYIKSIIIDDSYRLKIGDSVKVNDINHTINTIRKVRGSFFMITERITKTSQFILPLLGGTYEDFNFNNSLYNTYISKDYKYIYLVFKFLDSEEYLDMENKLTTRSDFVELLDPSPDTVVIKLSLPHIYKEDIKRVMLGRYSKVSASLKSKICIFHGFDIKSKTYKMLYQGSTLRKEMEKEFNCDIPEDIDLMTKPEKKKEIWDFQDISRKVGITS